MLAILHFTLLGFRPETQENLSKAFTTSITESLSPTKNVLSSALAECNNILLKLLMLSILLFYLI